MTDTKLIACKARITQVVSLVHVLVSRIRFHCCMEAPRWMHRGTNNRYHKSVAEVVVVAVSEAVVSG